MDYFVTQWQQILSLTIEHIEMTAIAVGCSILIGVPLGILVSYVRKLGKPVIGIANVVQAIPSMAPAGPYHSPAGHWHPARCGDGYHLLPCCPL